MGVLRESKLLSELHTWDKKLPLLFFCSWGNPCDYELGRKFLNLQDKGLQPSFFMWQLYRATFHIETSIVTWWVFLRWEADLSCLASSAFPFCLPCHKLPPQSVLGAFLMGRLKVEVALSCRCSSLFLRERGSFCSLVRLLPFITRLLHSRGTEKITKSGKKKILCMGSCSANQFQA